MSTLSCESVVRAAMGEPIKREGPELLYRCPYPERHATGDAHPSLRVNPRKNVWSCFPCNASGTGWALAAFPAHLDARDKLGVTMWLRQRGLLNGLEQKGAERGMRIEAEYDYLDESEKLLYQVVRYEPKGFRQRRPDGEGGWLWNLNSVRRVLYRLPEVFTAKCVLVCEGEKDCETARDLGLVATCNVGGAGKWREDYSEHLRGKQVIIIADGDDPGRKHAQQVAASLVNKAESVKVLEFAQAKDLSEWTATGGTHDALLRLIQSTAEWKPSTQPGYCGFKLTKLGDLLTQPDMPVEFVWESRLVAGTVSLVVSKPKVGKSTFARNLSFRISRGEDFLGLKTRRGECIYLALEEREEDIRNDFRAMGADGSEAIYIHAASAPAEGINALCDLVRQRRPVLVVIDPLFRLARIRDEKAYAETYAALGPLIDVARETGTHLVLVHHAGKSAKADPIDSPLGSTGIGGAVCTLIVLKRKEAYRTSQTVQRIGPEMPETVLEFDPQRHALSLGPEKSEADAQALSEAILEYLRDAQTVKEEEEIVESVEGRLGPKRKALRRLVEQGKVERQGSGKKGHPYKYSFSCSQHVSGTRERESEKGLEDSINTGSILVPDSSPDSILVPVDPTKQEKQFEEGEL